MSRLRAPVNGGLLVIVFMLSACHATEGSKVHPYDRLCEIYSEEVEPGKPLSAMESQRLADRIGEEVPEIVEQFDMLINAPREEFYPMLKQVAEHETGGVWDCPVIDKHYSSLN